MLLLASLWTLLGAMPGVTPPSLVGTPMPPPSAEDSSRILEEACEPGIAQTKPPWYPAEEVRRNIGGTVTLSMISNACGEVRAAWVSASSGNRNLDKKAVATALHWRLQSEAGAGGGYWSITVSYAIPPSFWKAHTGHSISVRPEWVTLGKLRPTTAPP
jgi:TonB family protein